MTALTPTTDLAEFMALPSEVRQEVQRWVKQLERVSKPIGRSIKRVARRTMPRCWMNSRPAGF